MKIEDKIEYYLDKMDSGNKDEALSFAKKLRLKGNILFYLGLIISIASFITFLVLTIIFIVNKQISFYQFIPFGVMIIAFIPFYLGMLYRRLSLMILEKREVTKLLLPFLLIIILFPYLISYISYQPDL